MDEVHDQIPDWVTAAADMASPPTDSSRHQALEKIEWLMAKAVNAFSGEDAGKQSADFEGFEGDLGKLGDHLDDVVRAKEFAEALGTGDGDKILAELKKIGVSEVRKHSSAGFNEALEVVTKGKLKNHFQDKLCDGLDFPFLDSLLKLLGINLNLLKLACLVYAVPAVLISEITGKDADSEDSIQAVRDIVSGVISAYEITKIAAGKKSKPTQFDLFTSTLLFVGAANAAQHAPDDNKQPCLYAAHLIESANAFFQLGYVLYGSVEGYKVQARVQGAANALAGFLSMLLAVESSASSENPGDKATHMILEGAGKVCQATGFAGVANPEIWVPGMAASALFYGASAGLHLD